MQIETYESKPSSQDDLGGFGENLACDYLIDNGYEIRHRNWSVKAGELDIVAQREVERYGETTQEIVLVEVKTKRSSPGAPPEVQVTHNKRRRLVMLARLYIKMCELWELPVRFDVIAIEIGPESIELRHHESAFDADAQP